MTLKDYFYKKNIMKHELSCFNCSEELIITINDLFFSEEPDIIDAGCPSCKQVVKTFKTDGWLFIRTKNDFLKEEIIEKLKENYFITQDHIRFM